MHEPLKQGDIESASVIFRGKIESYDFMKNVNIAQVTYKILKTYKGDLDGDTIQVYWASGVDSAPSPTMKDYIKYYGAESIIGLRGTDGQVNTAYIAENTDVFTAEQLEKAYWIVQPPCGEPFIVSPSPTKASPNFNQYRMFPSIENPEIRKALDKYSVFVK